MRFRLPTTAPRLAVGLVALCVCACTKADDERRDAERGRVAEAQSSGPFQEDWALANFLAEARVPHWVHESTVGIVDPKTFRTRVLLEQPDGEAVDCVRQLPSVERWFVVSESGAITLYSGDGRQLAHLAPPKDQKIKSSCYGEESESGDAFLVGADAHYRVVVTSNALHPIVTQEPTGNSGWLSSSESFYVNDGTSARVFKRNGDVIVPVGTTTSLYSDSAHKKGWLISREPQEHLTLWALPELEKKAVLRGDDAEFVSDIIVTSRGTMTTAFDFDGKLLWTKSAGPVLPRRSAEPTDYVLVSSTALKGGPGYALLDPRTGTKLRAFRYSGYKCSYRTVQRGATFAMLEGGLVSFQTPEGGRTVETNCAGTHDALFFREGTRALIFDTIFDWSKRDPMVQLETPEGWALFHGFQVSRDEAYIVGLLDSFDYPHPRRAALWDPETGELKRQLQLDGFELSPRVEYPNPRALSLRQRAGPFWGVFDPKTEALVWWMAFVRGSGRESKSKLIRLSPGCTVESLPPELRALVDVDKLGKVCAIPKMGGSAEGRVLQSPVTGVGSGQRGK